MGVPTALEQYALEIINRARLDPQSFANQTGTPLNAGLQPGTISSAAKQPFAFNSDLNTAADGHSNWMLATNTFSHTGSGGSSPGDRMSAAGYQFAGSWSWAENIGWTGTTGTINPKSALESILLGLYESAGHRANTFGENFKEVGLGFSLGTFSTGGTNHNAAMLTEAFARSGTANFITGVIYDDADNDGSFSYNEGVAGATISVRAASGGPVDLVSNWSAGGYSLATYLQGAVEIIIDRADAPAAKIGVTLNNQNIKIDMDDDEIISSSATATLMDGAKGLRLLGFQSLDATGNSLANTIFGNRGNNDIDGGAGDDDLRGGDGNDRYFVDSAGDSVTEQDGQGSDWVFSSVNYSLQAFDHVEHLTLTGAFNGTATGNSLGNTLTGNSSANTLRGLDGDDHLRGLSGSDELEGGLGSDEIDGGAGGADWASYEQAASGVYVHLAGGWGRWGEAEGDTLVNIERVKGSAYRDILVGDVGANVLEGNDGNDTLNGGDGDDILNGSFGNDVLRGQGGADRLNGGVGIDWAYYADSPDRVAIFLNSGVAAYGDAEGDEFYGVERIAGSAFNDILSGDSGSNYLRGNAGHDYLRGLDGLDYLRGDDGSDRFVFLQGSDIDVVLDFEDGMDQLYIDPNLVGGLTLGDDIVSAFGVQNGNHAYLDFGGGDSFRILNTDLAQLTDDLFIV